MDKTIAGRPETAAPTDPPGAAPSSGLAVVCPSRGMDAGEGGLGGMVLFVDDDPQVLETFRRVFRRGTFMVETASSGAQALDILERGGDGRAVDVVVTDEKMPGMSGSDLLAEIARRHPSVMGVMLTGEASLDAAIRGINQGRVSGS
jgi:CheY-like chemotaxis protein